MLTVGYHGWRVGVQAFSLDFNLRSHMKTHTGEYNECPYEGCDKRYCQEYKLRAHIAKEHTKPAKGTKKVGKAAGNDVRGKRDLPRSFVFPPAARNNSTHGRWEGSGCGWLSDRVAEFGSSLEESSLCAVL